MATTRSWMGAALLTVLADTAAIAQSAGPSPTPDHMPPPHPMTMSEMSGRAARRFPQPVRVGDLLGRNLLQPAESQPVLGRVAGLVRGNDGTTRVVVGMDGWFGLNRLGLSWLRWGGIGPRQVSVPVEAVALLGEHVALMDLTPADLAALPDAAPTSALASDETIRVGLVKPFH